MTGSDECLANMPCRRRAGWKAAGLAGLGLLALSFTASLPVPSAQAQSLRSWWWHADEGPPPIPPGDVGQRSASWHAAAPNMTSGPVPLAEIRRRASLAGLRLLGTPHLKGRVYIAFGKDTHGLLHHLAFDAYEGTLVENETSDVTAKAAPAHPASVGPPAPQHPPPPSQATKAPASPAPASPAPASPAAASPALASPAAASPAAASPAPASPAPPSPDKAATAASPTTETARELSPIKPQPGLKAAPTPQDSDIDKD